PEIYSLVASSAASYFSKRQFSQFVTLLQLFREYFDKNKIKYAYLDGSTTDRNTAVKDFKFYVLTKVFLIFIISGVVGLI
ncbi:hypothetical protein, partial [Sphingobacterium daejeonense]|uniref:hypothetical protein n=1 Tax=Sphingobacterium daejeonense TaxID=371142 RepID=UPI003D3170DC